MNIQTIDEYHGLWRTSANEGVPYSDDFPEALLVLPEFLDGALGAGKASNIDIKINITDPKKCILTINDDGKGITSEKRIKEWASKDTGNDATEQKYGHGSKKALTKFAPEYSTAKWKLYWRKQDKRGMVGVLNILSSPFKGLQTSHKEDDEDETTCPIHGTEWVIEFDLSVFGKKNTSDKIMESLQEICRVRYEPSYYHPYKIKISIIDGALILNKCSDDWKSLKVCLENEVQTGNVRKTHDFTRTIDSSTVDCSFYEITADGRTYNIPGLPTFGRKNMKSSRVHIARGGRYIEAMTYSKFMGKESHNSDNGKIGFVIFRGDVLPAPCTTKVKMQEECPILKKMIADIIKHIGAPIPVAEPTIPVAKQCQVPSIAKKSTQVAKSIQLVKQFSQPTTVSTPTPTKVSTPTPTKVSIPTPTKVSIPMPTKVSTAIAVSTPPPTLGVSFISPPTRGISFLSAPTPTAVLTHITENKKLPLVLPKAEAIESEEKHTSNIVATHPHTKLSVISIGSDVEVSVKNKSKLLTSTPVIYTPETNVSVDVQTMEEDDIQILKKLHTKYGCSIIIKLMNKF